MEMAHAMEGGRVEGVGRIEMMSMNKKNGGRLVNEDVRSSAAFTAISKRVWHE